MRILPISTVLLAILSQALFVSKVPADIVIGVAGPMSGLYAPLGKQIEVGARRAVDEINEAGGILGENLVLVTVDDECKTEKAEAAANQLIGKGVSFVIGHICDRPSLQAASIYAEHQVIQISPASQNPAFTAQRPNDEGGTYRFAARNTQQGDALVSFLIDMGADKKIALLHNGSVYGQALFDAVSAGLAEADVTPVLSEAFEPEQERYRLLSAKIVDSGAHYVFIGGTHTDAARLIRELDTLNTRLKFIGGDALVHAEFPSLVLSDNGKRVTLDDIFVAFPPDPRQLITAKATVRNFQRTGVDPVGYTIRGYSTVKIIETALRRTQKLDFLALIDAINAGDFETPLGRISFDETGDADLVDYVVHRWRNGTIIPFSKTSD